MRKKCTCPNHFSRCNSGFLYDFWVLFSLFLSSIYYFLLCLLFPWDVDFQLAYWCSSFNLTDFVMLNSKMANLVQCKVIVKISPWNSTIVMDSLRDSIFNPPGGIGSLQHWVQKHVTSSQFFTFVDYFYSKLASVCNKSNFKYTV